MFCTFKKNDECFICLTCHMFSDTDEERECQGPLAAEPVGIESPPGKPIKAQVKKKPCGCGKRKLKPT